MINNRQNGRRRGRGGQQARNGQPGGPDRGNRLDNRARGNAAQLLEKYKTLARDAQMQGDRVNTEYYLQFADHYFRVLSENRARFEEQRPARQNDNRDEFGGDEEGGDQRGYQGRDDQGGDDGWDDNDQQQQPEQQRAYAQRQERPERQERQERPERQAQQGSGDGEPAARAPREGGARERGRRNGNTNGGNGNSGNGNGFAAPDFLNEALSPRFELDSAPESEAVQAVETQAEQGEETAPKRRRTRRPRGGEAAPAEA